MLYRSQVTLQDIMEATLSDTILKNLRMLEIREMAGGCGTKTFSNVCARKK